MNSTDRLEIIDTNDWSIVDSSHLILVDRTIAPVIIRLNQLGYQTKYCCEGHFNGTYFYEQNLCDNLFLEQVLNDNHCFVTSKDKDTFNYVSDRKVTSIYIMFDKKYDFPNLPEGFQQDGASLEHVIEFLDKNDNRRTGKEIQEEIDKYNKILASWVNTLPTIK